MHKQSRYCRVIKLGATGQERASSRPPGPYRISDASEMFRYSCPTFGVPLRGPRTHGTVQRCPRLYRVQRSSDPTGGGGDCWQQSGPTLASPQTPAPTHNRKRERASSLPQTETENAKEQAAHMRVLPGYPTMAEDERKEQAAHIKRILPDVPKAMRVNPHVQRSGVTRH